MQVSEQASWKGMRTCPQTKKGVVIWALLLVVLRVGIPSKVQSMEVPVAQQPKIGENKPKTDENRLKMGILGTVN